MTKRTHANHPDHVRTAGSKMPKENVAAPQAHHSAATFLPHHDENGCHATQVMIDLLQREDGWLRMVPQRDSDLSWWKWKFTHGKHHGHYVMVRADRHDPAQALLVLAHKLRGVDEGWEKPTRDSYFAD